MHFYGKLYVIVENALFSWQIMYNIMQLVNRMWCMTLKHIKFWQERINCWINKKKLSDFIYKYLNLCSEDEKMAWNNMRVSN